MKFVPNILNVFTFLLVILNLFLKFTRVCSTIFLVKHTTIKFIVYEIKIHITKKHVSMCEVIFIKGSIFSANVPECCQSLPPKQNPQNVSDTRWNRISLQYSLWKVYWLFKILSWPHLLYGRSMCARLRRTKHEHFMKCRFFYRVVR